MAKDMTEEARKAQREYFRKWRRENPDKVREAKRRYWEKKAAEAAQAETATAPQ